MKVKDDFRLKTALPTLYFCMQYAKKVIIMGHIGRPNGEDVPDLSVAPIVDWLDQEFPDFDFPRERMEVLENLRFEKGEDDCDPSYAKELASMGDFYINEAFAAHHKAASTTMLPLHLPHACGFHFDHEVHELTKIRESATTPLVSIIGGAKIEDKLPVVQTLAKISDKVLIGGKLPHEIMEQGLVLPHNVYVAKMTPDGKDISKDSVDLFVESIKGAKQVIWSGPMGKYEDGYLEGTKKVAEAVINSGAHSTLGGGDTIEAVTQLGYLKMFHFVSVGGGAMLEFLVHGTLPTIEALK